MPPTRWFYACPAGVNDRDMSTGIHQGTRRGLPAKHPLTSQIDGLRAAARPHYIRFPCGNLQKLEKPPLGIGNCPKGLGPEPRCRVRICIVFGTKPRVLRRNLGKHGSCCCVIKVDGALAVARQGWSR